MGHVAVLEPSLAGRQGPEPRDTCCPVVARPMPSLVLCLYVGYPVYWVPTVALGPTSREVVNL
jgi:hypothetical protein